MADRFILNSLKGPHMKTNHSKYLTGLLFSGSALFLGACVTSNEETNIIDPAFKDAKVDARVAGQSLTGSFEQGKSWNNTITAPTTLENLNTASTQVVTLHKQAALAKFAANPTNGELQFDTSTTALGYVTVFTHSKLLLTTIEDSAKVKWDDQAKDTIKDNEHIISWKRVQTNISGKTEVTEITDADGDGFVNAVPGKNSKVKIVFVVTENGIISNTIVVATAGKDDNFDKDSDNTVTEASWTKTKSGTVIAQGAYTDGDADGIVMDNSKTNIVIAKYFEMNPTNRPFVKKVSFVAKVRILTNKTGDEPVSFSYEEEMKSGRINSATIKNRAGGDEIVKNDTMTVHLETLVVSADDTLKSATLDFVMNPGSDLKSDTDDVCYSVHITTEKKFGLERSSDFTFISDSPVPHGQEPKAGSFSGHATYANGKSASLKGSFSPTSFKAEYTGPEGGTATVEYNKSGEVIAGAGI